METKSRNTRRFSTALPSVASLRSKFERPQNTAVPTPALFSKASLRRLSTKSIAFAARRPSAIQEAPKTNAHNEEDEATTTAVALPRKKSVFKTILTAVGQGIDAVRRTSSASKEDLRRTSEDEEDEGAPALPQTPAPLLTTPSSSRPAALPATQARKGEGGNGYLLCSDGYSWTLDAMHSLKEEFDSLSIRTFLDPTTCRSAGMHRFLRECEAVFAFVDSALVSQTVQFQLGRACELNKHIVLFRVHETDEEVEALFTETLRIGPRSDHTVLLYTASPFSRERNAMLEEINRLLASPRQQQTHRAMAPQPAQPAYKYVITGYSPDICDKIACELSALGYNCIATREHRVRGNAMIVCLPSKFDQEEDGALRDAIQLHVNSGLPLVAIEARFPASNAMLSSLLPSKNNRAPNAVLPFDANVHAILRACDVSNNSAQNTVLRFQGDALEPFRNVCCKARRFSLDTDRFSKCRADIFAQASRTKLLALTAPAGWGKTTFLSEFCTRHHPICASLAGRSPSSLEGANVPDFTVGALFFFSRQELQSNAAACVKSISRQLMARLPGFVLDPVAAKEVVEDKASTIGSLLDVLVVQPSVALKRATPPTQRMIIVLDALEECEDFENLQIALNSKWTNSVIPPWLLLLCSSSTKPALSSATHLELAHATHAEQYLAHRFGAAQWNVPNAEQIVQDLLLRSQGDLLWLSVVEPLFVTWCENGAKTGELQLPGDNLLTSAVGFVFDGFCAMPQARGGSGGGMEHRVDRVKQMYSLALCAPRAALPIEIYSFCQDSIPPLLMVEDYKIKPLHALVADALVQVCEVSTRRRQQQQQPQNNEDDDYEDDDHVLLSEALEQAYIQNVTREYAAAHGNYHARMAGRRDLALSWFQDFSRLFEALSQCVRETGDVLRLAQDCEMLNLDEDLVDVLRLSNQACSYDVREFVGQVIGRLPPTHALVDKARAFICGNTAAASALGKEPLALPNPMFSGLVKAGGPLKRVFKHRSPVLAVAENNGFILACAGTIGFVWNSSNNTRVAFLKSHSEDVTACTFACSNKAGGGEGDMQFMAFTGSADKTAKFWQGTFAANPGTLQNVLACSKTFAGGHTQAITCVAFKGAADIKNAVIATGSQDHTICLWDFTTAARRAVLQTHFGDVRALCLVDGNTLISGSQDKTCLVWDLAERSVVGTLEGHARDVSAIAVFQRERIYTGSFDCKIRAFDFAKRKLVGEVVGGTQRINALAINATGSMLAASSYDGVVRVFDARTLDLLLLLRGHGNDVGGVRFCAAGMNGSQLVTCSLDCEVRLWSVSEDKIAKQRAERARNHADLVTCVAINSSFAISGSADGVARVWNLVNGDMLCELIRGAGAEQEAITACAVSKDGALALTGDAEGSLILWDCKTSLIKYDLSGTHKDVIDAIQISDDGQFARSVACDNSEEFYWDLRAKPPRTTVQRAASSPFPALPKTSTQEENTHVVVAGSGGGGGVGFTLDSANFQVQQSGNRTFGKMQDSFYLWEAAV